MGLFGDNESEYFYSYAHNQPTVRPPARAPGESADAYQARIATTMYGQHFYTAPQVKTFGQYPGTATVTTQYPGYVEPADPAAPTSAAKGLLIVLGLIGGGLIARHQGWI